MGVLGKLFKAAAATGIGAWAIKKFTGNKPETATAQPLPPQTNPPRPEVVTAMSQPPQTLQAAAGSPPPGPALPQVPPVLTPSQSSAHHGEQLSITVKVPAALNQSTTAVKLVSPIIGAVGIDDPRLGLAGFTVGQTNTNPQTGAPETEVTIQSNKPIPAKIATPLGQVTTAFNFPIVIESNGKPVGQFKFEIKSADSNQTLANSSLNSMPLPPQNQAA